MDWEKGYSASYYMTEVDPVTWNDVGRMEIKSGSITRKSDGLRQSADVDCNDYPRNVEQWVRIYLNAKQGENGMRVPLFTGLAMSPDSDIQGTWSENSVQCYSVLKPADDVVLARGWYASTDISCALLLEQLLAPVPAPKEFLDTSITLQDVIVAEAGETNLTMIERILTAMNWDVRVAGDGTLTFGEYPSEPAAIFDAISYDVLETKIKVTADWYGCPNVFMAVSGSQSYIAKDEDSDSPLSIQNRGREVWMYESSAALSKGESLEEYTYRRLKEEQRYLVNASYDRRFVPDVLPGDIVTLHYPGQGMDDDFLVTSQKITLGHGARTSETVVGVNA